MDEEQGYLWCAGYHDGEYHCDYGVDSLALAIGDCEYDEEGGWFCEGEDEDLGYWWCAGDDEDYACYAENEDYGFMKADDDWEEWDEDDWEDFEWDDDLAVLLTEEQKIDFDQRRRAERFD